MVFNKYQGTGNDFILIDGTKLLVDPFTLPVSQLCDRRFGIGADGLIIINKKENVDFEMLYFNSDGSQTFCGNGARCAVKFAFDSNYIESKTFFSAFDGIHHATIHNQEVSIQMQNVNQITKKNNAYVLDTGCPHYVEFVENLDNVDIVATGKTIRFSEEYIDEGINVNLVSPQKETLTILTYERGVENETYSCGTGAVASVLAHKFSEKITGNFKSKVKVKGGELVVTGNYDGKIFNNIYLTGKALKVYEGQISL